MHSPLSLSLCFYLLTCWLLIHLHIVIAPWLVSLSPLVISGCNYSFTSLCIHCAITTATRHSLLRCIHHDDTFVSKSLAFSYPRNKFIHLYTRNFLFTSFLASFSFLSTHADTFSPDEEETFFIHPSSSSRHLTALYSLLSLHDVSLLLSGARFIRATQISHNQP